MIDQKIGYQVNGNGQLTQLLALKKISGRYRPKLVVDPAFSLLLKLDYGIFNCPAIDLIDSPLSNKIFTVLN